jgi:2-dehydro-3-deoxyphosphooctonate aldolase (KDO 8-P synthase)
MNSSINSNDVQIGGEAPLLIIAGPCVIETKEETLQIAETVQAICKESEVGFVFKASFDKANRTSVHSSRGPGFEEGLDILATIKEQLGVAITTDIHEPSQALKAAEVADILQIPAFLCRQTDLLIAAAETGAIVNVKKGQFLSPDEMKHVVTKLQESKCQDIILTERGTFFGYNRLVNDFIGLGDMMEIGPPVCFDVTHSTQLPGAGKDQTAGRPDRAMLLAHAATAAGVQALFIECHPDPQRATSDASTMQPLSKMADFVSTCASISSVIRESTTSKVHG